MFEKETTVNEGPGEWLSGERRLAGTHGCPDAAFKGYFEGRSASEPGIGL